MTGAKGVKNGNAKLNPEKVKAIRKSAGKITQEELAEIYGVDRSTIANIIYNKTWKHV